MWRDRRMPITRNPIVQCAFPQLSAIAPAVLVTTGLYAVQQARRSEARYWMWAVVPVFFGLQQVFEGRVWQELDAGNAGAAVTFALGSHFFSHFLWLWWLPGCSHLAEPDQVSRTGKLRTRVMGGRAIFGAFAGALVYSFMLLHPE